MLRERLPILAAIFVLAACGQQQDPGNDGDQSATMPKMTFSATEMDDDGEVVMKATVKFASDGTWKRTGTEQGSGSLTAKQITRLDELVKADDFPVDETNEEQGCATVLPPYTWRLEVGDESVSNGNGGCVDSPSAVDASALIQGATDVGPTLESNR